MIGFIGLTLFDPLCVRLGTPPFTRPQVQVFNHVVGLLLTFLFQGQVLVRLHVFLGATFFRSHTFGLILNMRSYLIFVFAHLLGLRGRDP